MPTLLDAPWRPPVLPEGAIVFATGTLRGAVFLRAVVFSAVFLAVFWAVFFAGLADGVDRVDFVVLPDFVDLADFVGLAVFVDLADLVDLTDFAALPGLVAGVDLVDLVAVPAFLAGARTALTCFDLLVTRAAIAQFSRRKYSGCGSISTSTGNLRTALHNSARTPLTY